MNKGRIFYAFTMTIENTRVEIYRYDNVSTLDLPKIEAEWVYEEPAYGSLSPFYVTVQ